MIVIGYPGIGKTSLVREFGVMNKYIDLESSHFKKLKDMEYNHGPRNKGVNPLWAEIYCSLAVDLSRKGYCVFVSSHEEVRIALLDHIEACDFVRVCYPSLELKSEWIKHLRNRYQNPYNVFDKLDNDKNKRALVRAIAYYDSDIEALHNSGFDELIIKSMDYSLKTIIEEVYK